MSMQIRIDATSSIAPPTMAPTREISPATVCRYFMRLGSLRRRRREAERLADGLVPLLGAFGAAKLSPARQHGALDQLLVRLHLLGLHRDDGRLGELAHGAGLLAGVAVVGLAGRRLDRRPHLVLVGLELLQQEGLRLGIDRKSTRL